MKDFLRIYIGANLVTVVLILGATLFLIDDYKKKIPLIKCVFINMGIIFFLTFIDTFELMAAQLAYPTIERVIFSVIGYCVRPIALITIILYLLKTRRAKIIATIPLIINALIFTSAFYSDIAFSYNENNLYVRGPLGFASHFICFFYMLYLAYLTIHDLRQDRHGETKLLVFTLIALPIGNLLSFLGNVPGKLNTMIVFSTLFYYLYYYTQYSMDVERNKISENTSKRVIANISTRDLMTGLKNRSAFCSHLIQYDEYASLFYIILDINYLKLCNDKFGHVEGDKLIQDAALCIDKAFSPIGDTFRVGGDEFAILIHDHPEEDILDAIAAMEDYIDQINERRILPLSISYGYAERSSIDMPIEELFTTSDKYMYLMKYRIKKNAPILNEESILIYSNVLDTISSSIEDYLYLWDINKNEYYFYGDGDHHYPILNNDHHFTTMEKVSEVIYPGDLDKLNKDMLLIVNGKKKEHNIICRWLTSDGNYEWVNSRGKVIDDYYGKPAIMIGSVSNKTLRHLINPITNLFNRTKLIDYMGSEEFKKRQCYVILITIDNFSDLNYTYGRKFGNKLLIQFSNILAANGSLDDLYHIEDECFALLLDTTNEEEVKTIFNNIRVATDDKCNLSAGAVINDQKVFEDKNSLYEAVKQTLIEAQKINKDALVFYSKDDIERKLSTLELIKELEAAVENNYEGFYITYQPQVDAKTFEIFGAEALLRFNSKTRGLVSPDIFIPLLERSSSIIKIGIWVLRSALLQCKKWRKVKPNMHISVNLSTIQLRDKDIVNDILSVLNIANMPGSALTLEITESNQLMNTTVISNIFKRLKANDIEIAIDDFGTGYANVSYLKYLNINEVKIDRIFVSNLEKASYNYNLIKNIINFTSTYGIRVVCEGVESVKEMALLDSLGPSYIQGYLFGRPLSAEVFTNTYISESSNEAYEYKLFIRQTRMRINEINFIDFNHKKFLSQTGLGLWLMKIDVVNNTREMHIDETTEHILGIKEKLTPTECFEFWVEHFIRTNSTDIDNILLKLMSVDHMLELEFPWNHPIYGKIRLRISGKFVDQVDNIVTIEGYQRIIYDKSNDNINK